MSKLNKTAFIVEGPRESNVLNRMIKSLPNKSILDVMLILPAEMNLYMLWNEVKDDVDIDIIDFLKGKSKSIRDILGNMNSGDNETDKGKLYISYPMCEAYSDYIVGSCKTFTNCCYQNPFDKDYKNRVGKNNENAILTHLNIDKVREIINCYFDRITCLYDDGYEFDYEKLKSLSALNIFDRQSELLNNELIMVLSAFPEFIIDYYKLDILQKKFPIINRYYRKECKDKKV